MDSLNELEQMLGPEGPIAANHPLYEYRPGQIEMAKAVMRAIDQNRHLCVEAGTGTGKTLAYLVPAIFSNKRVIISTATKNLQEQLYLKDIPFLERALGRKLSVCYMKGRSNYLCWNRLEEIEGGAYLFSPHDPKYLKLIRKWAQQTTTGDRAELSELPEDILLWHHLDARREICTGQKCRNFDSCFVTRIRQQALQSDIIIVNHHLFFADLALRQGDFGSVLPDYSIIVFDEAHELEDVATQYFGVMISNYRIEEFARDTDRVLNETGALSGFLSDQIAKVQERAKDFFGRFHGREGRYVLESLGPGSIVRRGLNGGDLLNEAYSGLRTQLEVIRTALRNLSVQSDSIDGLGRRCRELQDDLSTILESESKEHVFWIELRGRGVFLWASPINISSIMGERLFSMVDSAILTSATLSTGGNFQFAKSRLGIDDANELIVPSHFDFANQSILYIPQNIPEPREEGWVRQASKEIETILEASSGRAFLLFTSYSQMEQVYQSLKNALPFPLMIQGEMSKSALLDSFRSTPNAVLFATTSFWQGVDVQGDQLSCVVIDKLPFSVPSDPVVAARIAQITESGGNAFYDYQIPTATILLKQGMGRLIRSKSDRGILALLDKRILTKSYGRMFLRSLPPAPVTNDAKKIRNFLAN
jgi:ATP-dependent DNA helicase DinG